MKQDERLVHWQIERIVAGYADDICLLLEHQSLKLEIDQDIHCPSFFIPATNRAMGIARTFIIDGVGYDIFPMGWERIERMADARDYNTTCLANAKILYARTEEDRARFESLQARLQANLQNPQLMRERAQDWLGTAIEVYQEILFSEEIGAVRCGAGNIADVLALAVAFMNGQFFMHGQTNQLAEIEAMAAVPSGFSAMYKAITVEKDAQRLKKHCQDLIALVKAFVEMKRPEKPTAEPDFGELATWYQELLYTFRRVYYFIDQGEVQNAFIWACGLQTEIDRVKDEYGLTEVEVLSAYSAEDLLAFRRRVEAVQRRFEQAILKHGAEIESYASIDEFLKRNA